MTDQSGHPDNGDVREVSGGGSTAGMPMWVKVFGLVVIVALVLLVVLMLTGGPGRHGPGRHMPGGEMSDRHTPPAEHQP
jgi:hypothetical protein